MRSSLRVGLSLFLALSSGAAEAAITQPTAWTSVYEGDTYPVLTGLAMPIPPGSGRVLLVAIGSRSTLAAAQGVSVTYGTIPLALAQGDPADLAQQHTYLYYLTEADLALASGQNLAVTVAGGISAYTWVYAAVFAGVEQPPLGPFTDTAGWARSSDGAAVGPFSPALSFGAGDWPIEAILLQRSGRTRATSCARSAPGRRVGHQRRRDGPGGPGPRRRHERPPPPLLHRAPGRPLGPGTDGSQHTASDAQIWASMSGVSLRAQVPTTTLGDGVDGTGATACPGDTDQKLGGFRWSRTWGRARSPG
jgi:hypothetical protein